MTQFVPDYAWAQFLAEHGQVQDRSALDYTSSVGLLPTDRQGEVQVALPYDLQEVACRWTPRRTQVELFPSASASSDVTLVGKNGTSLVLQKGWQDEAEPGLFALLRSIMRASSATQGRARKGRSVQISKMVRVEHASTSVLRKISEYESVKRELEDRTAVGFANTAHYMGAKQSLELFLVEGIADFTNESTTVLDLMCGAGNASRAFATRWRTLAADPMGFCTILAKALGAGTSAAQARDIIARIRPSVESNVRALTRLMGPLMESEDAFVSMRLDPAAEQEYAQFCASMPRYPEGSRRKGWKPKNEVRLRQANPAVEPFCLFTAYYAGVYFGVSQCVEIDSIRFAIQQLPEPDRSFALAALIASCSRLGTGYANQFAQPRALGPGIAAQLIERRARSIFSEFCVRLAGLGAASEGARRAIETIDGDWRCALEEAAQMVDRRNVLVYLDAPYTRDEYVRYYHPLETIVRYNYPEISGKGRVPRRGQDGYFWSPFFTRSKAKFTLELVSIVREVLSRGWRLAWSHSSGGAVNATDILPLLDCSALRVFSIETPHSHKGQGGRRAKRVHEKLTIFDPR